MFRTWQAPLWLATRHIAARNISSSVVPADPYSVLAVSKGVSREELRKQFFKLARDNHPTLTGNAQKYQQIVLAYETALKESDGKAAIAPWDGISGMTYEQAWQGKDFWRKRWEGHWSWRLAHMYKHKAEMDQLQANMDLREAQYNQVRDWMAYGACVMDGETKAEWDKYCDLWRNLILWSRTNKSNYRRYYISNQNVPAHMETVYKEHEFWRKFENGQWAEWDAFFVRAQKWADGNDGKIRACLNLDGPLLDKYNYLMKGRYAAKTTPAETMRQLAARDYPIWRRMVIRRQVIRFILYVMRLFERLMRATFPIFLGVLLTLWLFDIRPHFTVLDPAPLATPNSGPVSVKSRRLDTFQYAEELYARLQKNFSYDAIVRRWKESIPALPGAAKKQ